MMKKLRRYIGMALALALGAVLTFAVPAGAVITGISDPTPGSATFNLTAKDGFISTADGNSVYFWGFANDDGGGTVQYPGPTLIVDEGDTVTVNLRNNLPVNVSIIFPGQTGVTATGGTQGIITREAAPGGTDVVTYTFVASRPGTYAYYSGTRPELEVEMGLAGVLIVRPAGYDPATNRIAYDHPDTAYDHEYLLALSEMDENIHQAVYDGTPPYNNIDFNNRQATYWFVNGRTAMDTLHGDGVPWLPTQPYGALVRAHPGETILCRLVNLGREPHPFHTHGNNGWVIAIDGRLLTSGADKTASSPDLKVSEFTFKSIPGQTLDFTFSWTGQELGWDIFGHSMNDAPQPIEIFAESTLATALGSTDTTLTVASGDGAKFPHTHRFRAIVWEGSPGQPHLATNREVVTLRWDATDPSGDVFTVIRAREGTTASTFPAGAQVALTDHGRTFDTPGLADNRLPVNLPENTELTFGGFYSGSPFLGQEGSLPPGEGGLNPTGGMFFMWHSHNEREMTNFDIFPGGMMTQFVVESPSVPIP